MGQYYKIINFDQKEILYPFDFGNGLKLLEWSYDLNEMVLALMNLLAGDWAGDRVAVVGDYADSGPEEPWGDTYEAYVQEIGDDDLYSWAGDHFKCLHPDEDVSTEDRGYRYIYNNATRQFIDMEHCPVEWECTDKDTGKSGVTKIAPLPLLLAMGNGRGGGDYRENHPSYNLVGSWCSTVRSIQVSAAPLPGTEDYEELKPGFTENVTVEIQEEE